MLSGTFIAPEQILSEESKKKSCSWFQTGSCQYGLSCHSSHYTTDQLNVIRQQIQRNEWRKKRPKNIDRKIMETFVTKQLGRKREANVQIMKNIWKYPDKLLANGNNIPPSLRMLDSDLVIPEELHHWG